MDLGVGKAFDPILGITYDPTWGILLTLLLFQWGILLVRDITFSMA